MVGKKVVQSQFHESYQFLIKGLMGGMPELLLNDFGTGIFIQLTSPQIKVYKKYEVYDFSGIVGTVGGSLGLFIGFSFMDFMLMLINFK